MGETAENVAERYGVSRERQEAFAVESQRKAAEAQAEGRLEAEIAPVRTPGGEVALDGCLRPETTAEVLATLDPAFREDGTVTAGTSSPLTDGASACLVTTPAFAARQRARAARRPSARSRSPAAIPRSWASGRSRPRARCSSAPG